MFSLLILFKNKSHYKSLKVVYHNNIRNVFILNGFLQRHRLHFVSVLKHIWAHSE